MYFLFCLSPSFLVQVKVKRSMTLTILIRKFVGELLGEHLHVVHLLALIKMPPHGWGQLRVEHPRVKLQFKSSLHSSQARWCWPLWPQTVFTETGDRGLFLVWWPKLDYADISVTAAHSPSGQGCSISASAASLPGMLMPPNSPGRFCLRIFVTPEAAEAH